MKRAILAAVAILCLLTPSLAAPAPQVVASVAALRAGSFGSYANVILAGWYGQNTPGGGLLQLDAADSSTADNGCTVFVDAGGKRFKRSAANLAVTDCGAKGDGSTNDAVAMQSALTYVRAGGVVSWPSGTGCYRSTATLNVTQSLTISGPGNVCFVTGAQMGFNVTAGGFKCSNLTITGPQHATFISDEIGINVTGTFNAAAPPTYISGVYINGCTITNWGRDAVMLRYLTDFSVTNSLLYSAVYAGVETVSTNRGVISNNIIYDMNGVGSAQDNAYGITISRFTTDASNLTANPLSTDVSIVGNTIYNIPTWEGIDTHGGENISIVGNTVYDVMIGIAVGSSANAALDARYGPKNVTVSGNVLNSGVTDGSRGYGITFTGGFDQPDYATGAISGNIVTGFGDQTALNAAINVNTTNGLAIAGNSILYPSPYGILAAGQNIGLSITDNVIIDPWTDDVGFSAIGVRFTGDDNIFYAAGNSIRHFDKVATRLITSASGAGITISAGTGNVATLGFNYTDATTYVVDAGPYVIGTSYPVLPTSCTNQQSGSPWNNAGTIAVCP